MAKIAAIVLPSSRQADLPALASRMGRSLCLDVGHRVETETYTGERTVCAVLRVAPDPLNVESQPVEQGSLAGVFCGYYLSPSESSGGSAERFMTELVSRGIDGLSRADGVYAFAYWDKQRDCLVSGVDKLGMRPLYWAEVPGGGYAVASEINALIVLLDKLKTNWAAWEEQLTFGFLLGDHTFFYGIQRLGVAECITFRSDSAKSQVVEHFLDTIDIVDRPFSSFLEEQTAVFDDAMRRLSRLFNASSNTMLTLSGGYDSRRILGWLLNNGIQPTAFTVPEVGTDGNEFESTVVSNLCRTLGMSDACRVYPSSTVDHDYVRLMRDLTTDFQSDEHIFSATLAMGVKCGEKINFDGLAAGSQLSGAFVTHETFEAGGQERFIASRPKPARSWIRLPETGLPPLETRVRTELDRWGDNPNRYAYFYLLSRTRREIALAPLSIQANRFESLFPFLDRAMMRSALSFPPAAKVGADTQKKLIHSISPRLTEIPTIYTPGIANEVQYQSDVGKKVHLRGQRNMLRLSTRLYKRRKKWSLSAKQRLRFRVVSMFPGLSSDSRLRWELTKAERLGQLVMFSEINQSPRLYEKAIDKLRNILAERRNWCQEIK